MNKPLQRGGAAISVRELAQKLKGKKKFRRTTWREGTKEALTAKFAMLRVFPCREQSREQHEMETLWLLIEWRDGENEPANYFFSSLPKTIRRKPLIRLVMQRWRIERTYEDLKGELGLDHYEGRRFRGWHHHVSVALCCYAFVLSERVQHFPPRPETRWKTSRTPSRPERHFADSFITVRLAIARFSATWLPRCPACHRSAPHDSRCGTPPIIMTQ